MLLNGGNHCVRVIIFGNEQSHQVEIQDDDVFISLHANALIVGQHWNIKFKNLQNIKI